MDSPILKYHQFLTNQKGPRTRLPFFPMWWVQTLKRFFFFWNFRIRNWWNLACDEKLKIYSHLNNIYRFWVQQSFETMSEIFTFPSSYGYRSSKPQFSILLIKFWWNWLFEKCNVLILNFPKKLKELDKWFAHPIKFEGNFFFHEIKRYVCSKLRKNRLNNKRNVCFFNWWRLVKKIADSYFIWWADYMIIIGSNNQFQIYEYDWSKIIKVHNL